MSRSFGEMGRNFKSTVKSTGNNEQIAAAEKAKADVMLTTDDKLEKMARQLEVKVRVMNPLKFAWEVI